MHRQNPYFSFLVQEIMKQQIGLLKLVISRSSMISIRISPRAKLMRWPKFWMTRMSMSYCTTVKMISSWIRPELRGGWIWPTDGQTSIISNKHRRWRGCCRCQSQIRPSVESSKILSRRAPNSEWEMMEASCWGLPNIMARSGTLWSTRLVIWSPLTRQPQRRIWSTDLSNNKRTGQYD